jgi:thiol-disulfide isomerase/thioredoxin
MRRAILSVLLIAAFLGGTGVRSARADGVGVNDRAPELDSSARTAGGKAIKLADKQGGWVLVTFGAKWCKPCKKELPAWDKLAKKYKGKVLFVAVNINNKRKDGEAFMKSLKIKNMLVVYSPQSSTTSANNYVGDEDGEPTFPTTFVIDPKGIVRHVHKGFHKGDDKKLAKAIDKLLAGS